MIADANPLARPWRMDALKLPARDGAVAAVESGGSEPTEIISEGWDLEI